jgi:antitoxin component YwqK of YwqJK toxin-antitoxin module
MRYVTIFLLIFGFAYTQAQEKKIYFDENWKEISSQVNAVYYRTVQKTDSGYLRQDFFNSGKIQNRALFQDDSLKTHSGQDIFFSEDGKIRIVNNYKNGKRHGLWVRYDSLGTITYRQNFILDRKDGDFIRTEFGYTTTGTYQLDKYVGDYIKKDKNGVIRRKEVYEQDKMAAGKCYDVAGNEVAFYPEEEDPIFSKGKVSTWIASNTTYPYLAVESNTEGTVLVSFLVDKDGRVVNARMKTASFTRTIKVKRKNQVIELDEHDFSVKACVQNAVDLVASMPNWIPGKIENEPIRSLFQVKVTYRLQ